MGLLVFAVLVAAMVPPLATLEEMIKTDKPVYVRGWWIVAWGVLQLILIGAMIFALKYGWVM